MKIITISQQNINGTQTNAVNARELHKSLEIKKDFSDWVKAQISRAGLVKERDYITVPQKGVGGKFDSIEYILTLESAKHIAMMSQSKKGKEVRDYFIEIEKQYMLQSRGNSNELKAFVEILAPSLELMAQTQLQILELLKQQKPTVHNVTNVHTSKTTITQMRDATETEAEVVFIDAVRDMLHKHPDGLNQSTLLNKLGRLRNDKTSRFRLQKYTDVYWSVSFDGSSYTYNLM